MPEKKSIEEIEAAFKEAENYRLTVDPQDLFRLCASMLERIEQLEEKLREHGIY